MEVANACITPGGTIGTLDEPCASAGGAQLLAAEVELYDHDDPFAPTQTLVMNPLTLDVYGLRFDLTGNLVGANTSVSDPVAGAAYTAGFVGGPYYFALAMLLDEDLNECYLSTDPECKPELYSGARLHYTNNDELCLPGETDCFGSNVREFPALVTFVPVPLPGTAALALLALAAAGAVRRR
ncbi:MAG: hypothetical protein MUF16_23190 [Burkholderiaceae bacterium]|nr:hypothetical protein [Burkholderiaceae bacterium]